MTSTPCFEPCATSTSTCLKRRPSPPSPPSEEQSIDTARGAGVRPRRRRCREAGGVAYQRSLANFKNDLEKAGIPFTPEAQAIHDQEWDNTNLNEGTRPEMEKRGLSFNANQGNVMGNKL